MACAARSTAIWRPGPGALPGAKINYTEDLTKNRRTVRNVVGVLPGSDPVDGASRPSSSAHITTMSASAGIIGRPERVGRDSQRRRRQRVRHRGAHRNGARRGGRPLAVSTVARLRRLRRRRTRAPRLGPLHHRPADSHRRTVAMLNLDMMGRAGGSVEIGGMATSAVDGAGRQGSGQDGGRHRTITREGPGAGRSDDSSFLDRHVPAIHFFTGFHDDYHRPERRLAARSMRRAPRGSPRSRSSWRRAQRDADDQTPIRPPAESIDRTDVVLLAILIVAALLLVNAVYVAAEFAAVSVRRSRIRSWPTTATPLATWLLPLIDRPPRSIATSPPARSASRCRASCSARMRSARSPSG